MSKKVLSIRELEAQQSQQPNFGKGIALATGFDLGAASALDSRATVKTIAERDEHVTSNRAYEGMLVFVEEDKKTYQYVDGTWEEFGFNNEKFVNNVVDSLESTDTDKALSANQGKVLKGLVDDVTSKVDTSLEGLDDTPVAEAIEEAYTAAVEASKSYTDEKIEEVNQAHKELESKVDANEEAIEELKETTGEHAEKIGAIEFKHEDLSRLVTSVRGEITGLEEADKELASSIEELGEKVDQMKSDIDSSIEESIEEAKTEVEGYADSKVELLEKKITSPRTGSELNAKFSDLVVNGNLDVKGTINTIDQTELHVEDTVIEVNSKGADLTGSDVHLGLRANLGDGKGKSELVYCTDSGKWIVNDSHPITLLKNGGHATVKTLAYEEDIEKANAEMEEKIDGVTDRVDTLEGYLPEMEERYVSIEERIEAIEEVESVVDTIVSPSESMSLKKAPLDDKVELYVNGLLYVEGFEVSGQDLTWSGDFELESDDVVVAKYLTSSK